MNGLADDIRSLVDTNIVVYAYDLDDPSKQAVALDLINRLLGLGHLVLSSQVLNEFCSVMMRPNRPGRSNPDQLSAIIRDLESVCEIVPVTAAMTLRALGAMQPHGLSFWDGMIWAAAAENGISIVYTEDYQHRREVEGVRFVNPFLAAEPPSV